MMFFVPGPCPCSTKGEQGRQRPKTQKPTSSAAHVGFPMPIVVATNFFHAFSIHTFFPTQAWPTVLDYIHYTLRNARAPPHAPLHAAACLSGALDSFFTILI